MLFPQKTEVGGIYIYYNANPRGYVVGDCVVRAISKALGKSWEDVYAGLALDGVILCDLPNADRVWNAYLKRQGFRRKSVDAECDCYTVAEFAAAHPSGVYVMAIPGHTVCVIDGDWFDTFDSGAEMPVYYWEKERAY